MIRTYESDHPVDLRAFIRHHANLPGSIACPLCTRTHGEPVKTDAKTSVALPVRINHGRWIVECPFCHSAQLAHDGEKRFFCVECHNEAVAGRWQPLAWPKNRGDIEELLTERPEVTTRNWWPGESIKDLRQENAQRGLSS